MQVKHQSHTVADYKADLTVVTVTPGAPEVPDEERVRILLVSLRSLLRFSMQGFELEWRVHIQAEYLTVALRRIACLTLSIVFGWVLLL